MSVFASERASMRSSTRRRVLAPAAALAGSLALAAGTCSITAGASQASATPQPAVSHPAQSGQPFVSSATWDDNFSLNFFSPDYYASVAQSYAMLPLFVPEASKVREQMFTLIPQLGTSYSISSSNVETIHLQPNAKWQDGTAVTSQDVVDFMILEAVDDFPIWPDVDNVQTPNAHTVKITFYPNIPNTITRGWLAAITALPNSVYGRFMVSGLEQAAITYSHLLRTDPKAAPSSKAESLLKSVLPKLQAFAPTTLVGDGPFQIVATTSAQAQLNKWAGFYDARNVHVPSITIINSADPSTIYPMLFSHRLDWYAGGAPATILDQWKRTSDAHVETAPNDIQYILYFNNKRYPFDELAVRQAIAYVINRQTLLNEQDGGHSLSSVVQYPDGLTSSVEPAWITPAQLSTLNPYNYDPAKATSLLKGAGFKLANGQWTMPNGKAFTAHLIAPSVPPAALVAAQVAASMLSKFGIKATSTVVDQSGYDAQVEQGNFDIEWNTGMGGNLSPTCGISTDLATPPNAGAPPLYTNDPGIGVQSANVPGLGHVSNVVQTLGYDDCQEVGATPQMASLTWDWARFVNAQLPFLSYADNNLVDYYSSAHYSDWPPASSSLWPETGLYTTDALVIMIEDGYIRPVA
jgi:peptide/nickel transport system substrate-binding protein